MLLKDGTNVYPAVPNEYLAGTTYRLSRNYLLYNSKVLRPIINKIIMIFLSSRKMKEFNKTKKTIYLI